MKRTAILLLLSLPFFAYSHGQMPKEIKMNVTTPVSTIDIEIINGYDVNKCYQITHNDSVMPYQVCLDGKDRQSLNIPVRNIPDEVSENVICSLLKVDKGQMGTRMCTTVKTYYPASYL